MKPHVPPAKTTPRQLSWGARIVVLFPYLWLVLFFLLPFAIVLKISFSQTAIAQPPYAPVFDPAAGWEGIKTFFGALSSDNYALIASDPLYFVSYLKSMEIAAVSTVLLMLFMLPFWTSFLIRVYAWINILQHDGLLNQLLLALRLVEAPPAWLASDTAVYIGMVYSYLPVMVLPLYATLEKMDEALIRD